MEKVQKVYFAARNVITVLFTRNMLIKRLKLVE